MGDGRIFLKTPATLPLIKIYQMSLILAGSISLDSTFKLTMHVIKIQIQIMRQSLW
jgi:hypothetical protein